MSSEQRAGGGGGGVLTFSCTGHLCQSTVWFLPNTHLLSKHAGDSLPWVYTQCSDGNDGEMMRAIMMMGTPSRGREGLTLGAQSICAVLRGLAVPFARLSSVSRCRGVAFAVALPLALAAAYGPLAPLVPASIDCNTDTHTNTCGLAETPHLK